MRDRRRAGLPLNIARLHDATPRGPAVLLPYKLELGDTTTSDRTR